MDESPRVTLTRQTLIRYRKGSGKSRSQVALESGLSKHWLEKFEQSVLRNPQSRNLDRLSGYLFAVSNDSTEAA